MIDAFLAQKLFLLGFLLLLGWAAVEDFAILRIPNRIPLLIAILYLPFAWVSPVPVNFLGAISTGAIFFLVGMLLFHFGLMGGGDVKLMAAVGLWAGPEYGLFFILVTAAAGGILALIACTPIRFVLGLAQTTLSRQSRRIPVPTGILPYGVAIATGGFAVGCQYLVA